MKSNQEDRIKEQVVVPLRVTLHCECGGVMRQTGTSYPTSPMLIEHECKECSKIETARKAYPYIKYVSANRDSDFKVRIL